ncbi:MAG: protein-glutamate O-methyltransferase [Pseudomonadota bacterium]
MVYENHRRTGSTGAAFIKTFDLKPREYETIRTLVKEKTGINLGLNKRDLVLSRLAKRLRALGLDSFRQYLEYLEGPKGPDELVQMINHITTNKTNFFREMHHFEFLTKKLFPELIKAGQSNRFRQIRAWSAGCSSGEEPYSICITASEFLQDKPGWEFKLLATDLDTTMLQKASDMIYESRLLEPVPRHLLHKYFKPVSDNGELLYQASQGLRNMITFRKFNLMRRKYPLKAPVDFIFCRNVLIYFDQKDKTDILTRFHSALKPGGHFFVGHSESLMMVKHLFKNVGTTVYQKI